MGYYTTLTIDNAVVHNVQNSPVEFANKIIDACKGVYYKTGRDEFALGMDVPFVFLQKPREFLETTTFIYKNGRLHEMNVNSPITNELKEGDPEKFAELLTILEETLGSLGENKLTPEEEFEEAFLKLDTPKFLDEEKELITEPVNIEKEVINSGEANVIEINEEEIVAKWLKDNKIPMTVAKLKKLKPVTKTKK